MAFDEVAGFTVAAISCAPAPSLETWIYDGVGWSPRVSAVAPSFRHRHTMTYDAARRRVVLFGGIDANSQTLGDTWLWDGMAWNPAQPLHSPSPAHGAPMAFDAHRGVVVLFGRFSTGSETWEWDGVDWSQKSTSPMPVLNNTAMAYDPIVRKVQIFGGGGGSPTSFAAEFDGVDWTVLPGGLASGAPFIWYHGLVYDANRGVLVVVGGRTGTALPNSTVWERSLVGWLRAGYRSAPSVASVAVYDSARSVVLHCTYGATAHCEELVPSVASFAATVGCSDGTRPLLRAPVGALPALGAALVLDLQQLPPVCFTALAFGWGSTQNTILPGTNCSMYFSPVAAAGLAASGGSVQYPLIIPSSGSLAGFQFWVQAAVTDPVANVLGVTLSNALRVTVY